MTNSSSEETRDPDLKQGSETPETRNATRVIHPGSGLDQTGYTSDELQTSASLKTTDLESASPGRQESMPQLKPVCSLEPPVEHRPKLAPGETTNLQPGPNTLDARVLQPGSTLQQDSELKPDLHESALKPEPRSVWTGSRDPGLRFSRIPRLISGLGLKSEFKSEETPDPLPGPRFDLTLGSKSPVLEASEIESGSREKNKSEFKSDQSRSSLGPEPKQHRLLETVLMSARSDIQPAQTTKVQSGFVMGADLDLDLDLGQVKSIKPHQRKSWPYRLP